LNFTLKFDEELIQNIPASTNFEVRKKVLKNLILIFSLESIVSRMQWVWMQAFSHVRDLLGVVN
jgi:hypothetical protein